MIGLRLKYIILGGKNMIRIVFVIKVSHIINLWFKEKVKINI